MGWTANYSSIQRTFTTNGLSGLKLFKSSALALPFDVYTNFFFPTLGIIVLRICFVFAGYTTRRCSIPLRVLGADRDVSPSILHVCARLPSRGHELRPVLHHLRWLNPITGPPASSDHLPPSPVAPVEVLTEFPTLAVIAFDVTDFSVTLSHRVASREQAVTGSDTGGVRRMSVSENQPFSG